MEQKTYPKEGHKGNFLTNLSSGKRQIKAWSNERELILNG